MSRYFFHLSLPDRVILDREGWKLPNMDAARARALDVARRMLASGVVKRSEDAAFQIVGTVSGLPFVVPFTDARQTAVLARVGGPRRLDKLVVPSWTPKPAMRGGSGN
jgi:hypothetical protein